TRNDHMQTAPHLLVRGRRECSRRSAGLDAADDPRRGLLVDRGSRDLDLEAGLLVAGLADRGAELAAGLGLGLLVDGVLAAGHVAQDLDLALREGGDLALDEELVGVALLATAETGDRVLGLAHGVGRRDEGLAETDGQDQ